MGLLPIFSLPLSMFPHGSREVLNSDTWSLTEGERKVNFHVSRKPCCLPSTYTSIRTGLSTLHTIGMDASPAGPNCTFPVFSVALPAPIIRYDHFTVRLAG